MRCTLISIFTLLMAGLPALATTQEDSSSLPPLKYEPAEGAAAGAEAAAGQAWTADSFLDKEPLPDLKVVRQALKGKTRESISGLEAASILGSTTVEYRTGVGLGIGISSDTEWSLSQSFRIAPHLNVGLYLLQSIGQTAGAAVRSLAAPEAPTDPAQQVQFRLSWDF